ncbi:hypothetical protein UFOVP594_21 [uncultured Caudovirales phage]|uniref:Uncharacterized protein n=1 Tax=uncultured Caudovirales phage TaxID=2100421 RepID=A0A6J5MZW9_9CAUD|nr:hypothetical protein UFOVP594_21 [uncultured Caudovirales phage]
MSIKTIKDNIKLNLDALVTSSVIAGCTITDIKKNPLGADIPDYPYAYLMPPSVNSDVSDNRSNLRTYTFDVVIFVNAENLTSTTELEEMIEDVLNKFDNDPTLGGAALGGVLPVSSAPQPLQHNNKDLIMVVVTILAKEIVTLTFS